MKAGVKKVAKFFHPNTSDDTILNGIRKLGLCDKESLDKYLRSVYRGNKTFNRNLNENSEIICDVFYEVIIKTLLDDIIASVNAELSSSFRSVRYIAPLRATAERYYRHQDLQADEIDHTGSNLAMLLKSLSQKEKNKFSEWTMESFGFSVRVEELGLHYALKIKSGDDSIEYNINEMGFGFSQILPIVASIWLETRKSNKEQNQLMFVIEQPELHLHPEYQGRLAKLFASTIEVAKEKQIVLKIIFETHSKTMVDTLGDCIEDGIIQANDVNIALFQKKRQSNITEVSFSKFGDNGILTEWPIGFFSGRT